MNRGNLNILYLALSALTVAGLGWTAELKEPLTLSSSNGVLDLLMIAKAASINTLPSSPVGWVYEICKRTEAVGEACPAAATAPNYYGGTLLKLNAGDLLKIHFVNQLPPVTDSEHASQPGFEFLTLNPTNIHTHGMLVSPHGPTASDPTYGDNVFVLTFNAANGKPAESPHMHSAIRYDFTDYTIPIPAYHPSGMFWFHPHAHGLALNQVSAGLSGIIEVGKPGDYLCADRRCANLLPEMGIRRLILKDTQVLADGTDMDQEDPSFCTSYPQPGEPPREGECPGTDNGSGEDYTGGTWYFTINGQRYPTISVTERAGEIWRITNASGSRTYDLTLADPVQGRNLLFQVLSVDGVSVSPTPGISAEQLAAITAGKFEPEACPGAAQDPTLARDMPLCTRRLHMMPSSRVEVWVSYRDVHDNLHATPKKEEFAVLRSQEYTTGLTGDQWPMVDLARVEFKSKPDPALPSALTVNGEATAMLVPTNLASALQSANQAVTPDASCSALPPGHMRRIYFGVPSTDPSAFGLAYEEIDRNGEVVGAPATDLVPFNPMHPTICVPLGAGNTVDTERWELVNVATEDHNFHIHQTKFRVLSQNEVAGTAVPPAQGLVMDNVPLASASGSCGAGPGSSGNPISDWRAGVCKSKPVVVEIPFAIAGDYVYHCHILEHEDGGMMARIRVRPTPR